MHCSNTSITWQVNRKLAPVTSLENEASTLPVRRSVQEGTITTHSRLSALYILHYWCADWTKLTYWLH